jgi:hypothetical protein
VFHSTGGSGIVFRRRAVGKALTISGLLLLSQFFVSAGDSRAVSASVAESPVPKTSIVLMVDHSLSLSETDPDELRLLAAQLFVELLDPERDQVAIVSFAHESDVLTQNSPDSTNGFSQDREYLKGILTQQLGNDTLPVEGGTDFLGALGKSYDLLRQADILGNRSFIVAVTDGAPCDPETLKSAHKDDDPGYRRDIEDVVTKYHDVATLFPITFTSPSAQPGACNTPDEELMKELADETGGLSQNAKDISEVASGYIEILRRVGGLEEVVRQGSGSFAVPPGTQLLMTAVQGLAPVLTLTDGSGKPVQETPQCDTQAPPESLVQWSCLTVRSQPQRELVAKINEPAPGGWHAALEGATGELYVLAMMDWKPKLLQPVDGKKFDAQSDIPVEVAITDTGGGAPYTNSDVLSKLPRQVTVRLLDADGRDVQNVKQPCAGQDEGDIEPGHVCLEQDTQNPYLFKARINEGVTLPVGAKKAKYAVVPQIVGLKQRPEGATIEVATPGPSAWDRVGWLFGLLVVLLLSGVAAYVIYKYMSSRPGNISGELVGRGGKVLEDRPFRCDLDGYCKRTITIGGVGEDIPFQDLNGRAVRLRSEKSDGYDRVMVEPAGNYEVHIVDPDHIDNYNALGLVVPRLAGAQELTHRSLLAIRKDGDSLLDLEYLGESGPEKMEDIEVLFDEGLAPCEDVDLREGD